MKILKRNQLIILIVSLMLITAGYLNFTANNDSNTIQTTGPIAELGDATLVNSKPNEIEEEINSITDISEEANQIVKNEVTPNETNENKQTSNNNEDQYFVKSKLERDTMYSQMLETYQEIYNNSNASGEQKIEAMKEITKISNLKNAIMIAENLVTAKGFEDIVIFVNNTSISVIIKAEELTQEQIAQIQYIISRELNSNIENIHISTK